ncbi:hypothetical protein CKM354_000881800 [Cercospora kikuchii]|uniref:Uncharacterized protein n=1 Tax=Cercospora kikuchii TaxID=84275 RepID=A0A9P3FFP3_9PEZI|nr:uncharacterized protein CKM354_000881800 [Cercospora kikuchii]GIZ45661.1 hypothetical protein CKM354_000881800 [Cercospora kikuchii]
MVRIKSECPRAPPRQHTPGKGGPLRGKGSGGGGGSNANGGGGGGSGSSGGGGNNKNPRGGPLHPALMLSNQKMMEILRCDDIDLDMIKHAAYHIMKAQSPIPRKELRTKLAEQETEFEEMLSGERWEGLRYPDGRTFETDINHLLIKIMSIARKKINSEAKKNKAKKAPPKDRGNVFDLSSSGEEASERPVFKKFEFPRALQSPGRIRSTSPSEAEQDYRMSGGLPDDSSNGFKSPAGGTGLARGIAEHIFGRRIGELQSPLLRNALRRSSIIGRDDDDISEYNGILGNSTRRVRGGGTGNGSPKD